jgi:hypothetical protein
LPPPPFNWRNGGSRRTNPLGSLWVDGVAAAPTAPGPTGIKAVTTAVTTAIAAVFPVAGSGSAILAAAAIAAAATSITAAAAAAAIAAATTTAVAAAAAVTTTTAALSASASATSGAGFGLVDAKGPAHQLGSLQPINGPRFHLVIRHLHKSETPLAACVPLQGEGTIHNITKAGEKFNDVLLLCAEGKIAYKDAHERGWGNRYGCRGTRRVSDVYRLDGLRNSARQ